MISDRILSMLNQQYRNESYNAIRYDQRRGWCEFEGFNGSGAFWKQEADGERGHAQEILNYIIERSAKPTIEPIDFMESGQYANLLDTFDSGLKVEIETTAQLGEIYRAAFDEADFMTVGFIAGMIKNQIEEEGTLVTILDRYRNYKFAEARDHDIDIWVKDSFVS